MACIQGVVVDSNTILTLRGVAMGDVRLPFMVFTQVAVVTELIIRSSQNAVLGIE